MLKLTNLLAPDVSLSDMLNIRQIKGSLMFVRQEVPLNG